MQCPCCGEVRATARPATASPTSSAVQVVEGTAHRHGISRLLACRSSSDAMLSQLSMHARMP
eukprot:3835971-Prymnesium_polylepis.1